MFLDTSQHGGGGEPWTPTCQSCRGIIAPGQKVEEIHFATDDAHQLHDMNGTYHAECARPILSVKRAYDMLNRWSL